MRYFAVVTVEMLTALLFLLPRYRSFNWLKSAFLRMMWGAKVGSRVVYYSGVTILPGRGISIGNDVDLAKGVLITTGGGVSIGDRVLIGYGSHILSTNHRIPDRPGRSFDSGHERRSGRIDNEVWIGAQCGIWPGVSIGEGSVVAAGSVVTTDVPSFCVVGGVPARLIRARN